MDTYVSAKLEDGDKVLSKDTIDFQILDELKQVRCSLVFLIAILARIRSGMLQFYTSPPSGLFAVILTLYLVGRVTPRPNKAIFAHRGSA